MSNNPKMMLSVSLVMMWIVYLTCMSIITHNTSNKEDNGFIYILAFFGLIVTIVTPGVFLMYMNERNNFLMNMNEQNNNSNISVFKTVFQLCLVMISLVLLIVLSLEEGRSNEEKKRIKTSQNAAISMFVISVIFYGVIGGVYYKGGEAMSKEIKTLFIEKVSR